MITTKEIIYISVAAILFLYSVGLTVTMCMMSRRIKQKNSDTDIKLQKNADLIEATDKKLDSTMEAMDKQFTEMADDTDRKIKDMGQEIISGTTLLIEQKASDVAGRLNDINTKLNIMDSTVKNLEREKIFLQGVILGKEEKNAIEGEYTELPEGVVAGAKRAVEQVAEKSKKAVSNYYPIIKKNAPGIVSAALKFAGWRRNRKDKE